MLNTSIIHPTIVGNKVCRTYEPPAKTEMRADPLVWPAVSLTIPIRIPGARDIIKLIISADVKPELDWNKYLCHLHS